MISFLSPGLVDSMRAAKRHSSGRSLITKPARHADPPELEWHHLVLDHKHEHIVIFRGPTGQLRVLELEEHDTFPCDIDDAIEDEQAELWRMWRRAMKVSNQFKISLTHLIVRCRGEVVWIPDELGTAS